MLKPSRLLPFALLAVVVVAGIWYALRLRPGMTKANFQRIQIGMTLEEVEAILGRPPGWGGLVSGTDRAGAEIDDAKLTSENESKTDVIWYIRDDREYVMIVVGVDEHGKVANAFYRWSWFASDPPSVLDRIRLWLGS